MSKEFIEWLEKNKNHLEKMLMSNHVPKVTDEEVKAISELAERLRTDEELKKAIQPHSNIISK